MKSMRCHVGWFPCGPLSLHGRPTNGLPFLAAVTRLHPSKVTDKPVFDKNKTHVEALDEALWSVLDWQSELDSKLL